MSDDGASDQERDTPPTDADDQIDAANAFARAEGGARIEPPGGAGGGGAGGQGGKTPPPLLALFVRVPSEGYGAHRFFTDVGGRLREKAIFRIGRKVVVVEEETGAHQEMSADWFTSWITEYMIPAKFIYDSEAGITRHKEVTIPSKLASACLASDQFLKNLRTLDRVNMQRMPVLRTPTAEFPRGRMELLPLGYDAESRTYTLPGALPINPHLTLEEARRHYMELVKEFPFGDYKEDTEANRAAGTVGKSRSMSVHLANMISMFGQGLLNELNKRLHFVYTANAQRSGKTLLAQAAVVPIFGPAKTKSLPKDDAELRKMLATAAFQNAPYFFLDDLEGKLNSTALNAFMTSSTYSDRMFNAQEDRDARKQTVVIITGNNLGLSTDIANRTLRCQLYTDEFNAQARTIRREIDEEYLARPEVRRDLLSALWCFVRSWDEAGRPTGRKLGGRVLKGFEPWCDTFGGIVIAAGFSDPMEAPPADDWSGDTESSDMDTLVGVLVKGMDEHQDKTSGAPDPLKKATYTFDDLIEASLENDCFTSEIRGTRRKDKEGVEGEFVCESGTRSKMGKMFSGKYGGRKFRLEDGRVVKFGHRGRNRHRKYEVEIMEAKA